MAAPSLLLNTARALDDQQFIWRVTAAMLFEAEYKVNEPAGVEPESLAMAEWVMANPMVPLATMNAMVAVNEEVAEGVTVNASGGVNTDAVTDTIIKYVVGAKWDVVAKQNFPQAAVEA
jgi:hypothetical protein